MLDSIRNQFEKKCPKCGAVVIVKEVNDGTPARCTEYALCPNCKEVLCEKSIVGTFETEICSV